MGIATSRINNRLGTYLRPLFQTSKGSFRPFSIGTTSQNGTKLPTHIRTQALAKNIHFFEGSGNSDSRISFFTYFAGGITALASLLFYSLIDRTSAEELSEPKTDAEDDLYVDFQAKIDARRYTMVDADNKEYDLGSYFHGYGKGLVKGMNLHFRKVVLDNGTHEMELTFKVNHVFLLRLQERLDGLARLTLEEQQALLFAAKHKESRSTIKCPTQYPKPSFAKIRTSDCFRRPRLIDDRGKILHQFKRPSESNSTSRSYAGIFSTFSFHFRTRRCS
jgi:hypothetical protein